MTGRAFNFFEFRNEGVLVCRTTSVINCNNTLCCHYSVTACAEQIELSRRQPYTGSHRCNAVHCISGTTQWSLFSVCGDDRACTSANLC